MATKNQLLLFYSRLQEYFRGHANETNRRGVPAMRLVVKFTAKDFFETAYDALSEIHDDEMQKLIDDPGLCMRLVSAEGSTDAS